MNYCVVHHLLGNVWLLVRCVKCRFGDGLGDATAQLDSTVTQAYMQQEILLLQGCKFFSFLADVAH